MKHEISAIEALEAGLRATSLRQALIANNIANLDTPGYRRKDVQFKEVLAKAMDTGEADLDELNPKIVTPNETEVNAQGNDVDLDTEMGEMLKNSGQYKLFVRMLAKVYQRMNIAMQVE
jgi:flagellar basal-body rod protein FlgB